MPEISFLGGAGTVTGSKYLVTVHGRHVLVDCGLFQGIKEQRLMNREPLNIDLSKLDAIILTHAHLDHTGYLPVLVKNGYSGPIYCSAPTIDLTKLILLDSARIQMEDADYANETHTSKHSPALPLYNTIDAQNVTPLLRSLALDEWHNIVPSHIEIRLSNSGHILGSTFVEMNIHGQRLVFSGDLGREKPLLLQPRKIIQEADTLVLESTYGDRDHEKEDAKAQLEKIINRTIEQQGTVLIPAFAIGRSQEVLYLIQQLKNENRIPKHVPVYLDSPMADKATHIFDRYSAWHTLNATDLKNIDACFEHISTASESAALSRSKKPCIIIAGSGMLNGGRIRHHLAEKMGDPKNEIVLMGYQAAGTPGRFLKERASELKLFGKYLPVNLRVSEITALSAHADQHEILRWVHGFNKKKPSKIFLVHGEANASEGLRVRIKDEFQIQVHIAKMNEKLGVF